MNVRCLFAAVLGIGLLLGLGVAASAQDANLHLLALRRRRRPAPMVEASEERGGRPQLAGAGHGRGTMGT